MSANKTFPLGGIAIIEQIEKHYGLFSGLFGGFKGRMKNLIPCVKLLIYNKLTHSVSIHQIRKTYPDEMIERLGATSIPSERTLYRTLERIGRFFPILLSSYVLFIMEHGLADSHQFIDFSSTYIEGNLAEFAKYGYSRDRRPDKMQINFGISTGMNNIPTALTIHKGNTQDTKMMKEMLKFVKVVVEKDSMLIFDTGANTRANKKTIVDDGNNYLTLKAKKVNSYKDHIRFFMANHRENLSVGFEVNDRHYSCVKRNVGGEVNYIYFCPELCKTHLKNKERKFRRNKETGNKLLRKRKIDRLPSDSGWVELVPRLQHTLLEIENPYINGIEGFFILESSVDEDPEKMLCLYKNRDKAEKFIRNLKEGIEIRPLRHWSRWSIIGIFFISFLANFLINLTQLMRNASKTKNVKLLKKSLINLSLTVVYPKRGFRFHVLSNVSEEILDIFGDFVWKYEDKSLKLRW